MTTYKSLLTEVRNLKRIANDEFREKLLTLLNSGEEDQINQALMLNDTLGILSDKEIGQVMVINGKVNIKEQWKQGGFGWYLLEKYPNHPMWNNLRELNLSYLNLTSIPSSLGNLRNLRELNLSGNLASLPKEIGNLKNLKELQLLNSKLTSLPKEIGNLKNLIVLGLSYNNLSNLPSWIGNLKNLLYLDLYGNNLTSLPEEIGNLTNLKELYLENSGLTIEDVPPNLRKVTLF